VFVRDIAENVYGSAEVSGKYIPALGLLPASVGIYIRGTPRQKSGRLKIVIGIADESGNETRAKLNVKGV
jgi:hypothetical protein